MDTGVSLSDIAAVTGKDGMFDGNGGGMWIFALLILLLIGGGGFFGNNRTNGEPVTEAGLCNAMNFNNLENAVGRLNDNLQHDYQGLQNGICNMGYESLRNFNGLQSQLADCCCTTQRAIDGVNYNNAINTAAINANTTEQTQKILDAMAQNKIENLQAQVNQLQLQSAMCGVVRYPNATTFSAGMNPYFNGCGCGCGNV
jgi:hypothetical protein|nr:MAG TPA: hypothetical protein [Caudoviricetes sp.]